MIDWNNMTIGEKIKHSRETQGLSQAKLAKLSGIAQSSISYIESDAKKPNIETITLIAKALDAPVSSFVDGQQIDESLSPQLADLVKTASLLSDERIELLVKLAHGLLSDSKPI